MIEHPPNNPRIPSFFANKGPGNPPLKPYTGISGPCILDTLAQPRKVPEKEPQLLKIENLQKRAKSKFFSNSLALALVDLRSPLKNSYWNTFHCNELLTQDGQTVTAKYCNNRWCNQCNRIRTAKLIHGYTKPLSVLKDKRFVTLTIPNMKGEALKGAIEKMTSEFLKIKNEFRMRKTPIVGIRKMECTYNSDEDTFHPHFHFVVSGENIAREIISEWLKRFPNADIRGQDETPANEETIHELFKYFTKIITKSKRDNTNKIHVHALDTIFRAMRKKRVFQPMGIKKVSEDIEEIQSVNYDVAPRSVTWSWDTIVNDWIDYSTGEILTNYVPSDAVLEVIRNMVRKKPPPD